MFIKKVSSIVLIDSPKQLSDSFPIHKDTEVDALSPHLFKFFLSWIRPSGLFRFRLTSEIMNPFRYFVGFLRRRIDPSQGLYLHRTAQHTVMHTYTSLPGFKPTIPMSDLRPRGYCDRSAFYLALKCVRKLRESAMSGI